ncbi:Rod binding domain-containing protein [Azospirillum lipoferum]|uniref:Flagellar biosynthesis protein FlgJ n=1 Tax=Azospirillum lipoferum TaxID=193 RepID=A0A5A9GBU2_AZOLI|nr:MULTISPECIES: rod-binding protein [Azospirillum]KAA0591846.1 flagellar biosynthesis protein FlgJ [Azospirillum lipoferum]MCP1614637.1 Rod binding domain-containing protein [Azospirillum lipoferum]MDW5537527.1 rod-binding protein [Azospirillum sp. NL1]
MEIAAATLRTTEAHTPATATPAAPNPAAADKVAKEFEAMLVGQLMESMFAGMRESPLFGGGGPAEKPWRSMMLQEYGKAIAESGTLGIGKMTHDEIARLYASQAEQRS